MTRDERIIINLRNIVNLLEGRYRELAAAAGANATQGHEAAVQAAGERCQLTEEERRELARLRERAPVCTCRQRLPRGEHAVHNGRAPQTLGETYHLVRASAALGHFLKSPRCLKMVWYCLLKKS